MERKTLAITGDILRATAAKLWSQLPQFKDIAMPRWSAGWLSSFKRWYGIKQHTKHEEAASVNSEVVKSQLEAIHERLRLYANKDIYNMDETALYWKTVSDRNLATIQVAGGKVINAQITANFCCNSSGTDKLPV